MGLLRGRNSGLPFLADRGRAAQVGPLLPGGVAIGGFLLVGADPAGARRLPAFRGRKGVLQSPGRRPRFFRLFYAFVLPKLKFRCPGSRNLPATKTPPIC